MRSGSRSFRRSFRPPPFRARLTRARLAAAATLAAAGAGWALFESQWVERVEVNVPVPGLPPELEGFRILHLSDFHLGNLSLGSRALSQALAWASERKVDLVALTGDLVTRRRGGRMLRRVLADLHARYGVYAVLGNHEVAESRDPFAQAGDLSDLGDASAVLLADSTCSFEARGVQVQVAGVDPVSYRKRRARPGELADRAAGLRILLCHYPRIVDRLPAGAFHLVLAGHMHGGQICIPTPFGKIRLEHLRAPYWEGLYRTPAGPLYVSRGVGTSLVPFRFLARPEVAVLTLTRED